MFSVEFSNLCTYYFHILQVNYYYFTTWDFCQIFSRWFFIGTWVSPQVSRTHRSILADLNNAVFWTVFTRPVISKSSTPCTNPLVTVPKAPITISINIIIMYQSFFQFPAKLRYLFLISLSFNFTLWSAGTAKSTFLQVLFFFLGLHVNAHKTEYMCYNQTGDISTLDGTPLKLVDKFIYQGNIVSSTEKDIDTRLTKAWTAINRISII